MAKKKDARFTKVLEEGCLLGGSEIWVDTQTGVQYLLHYNGNAAGLTVLVDAEGKPLLDRRTPDAPEFRPPRGRASPCPLCCVFNGVFRASEREALLPAAAITCCGAQNFAAAFALVVPSVQRPLTCSLNGAPP